MINKPTKFFHSVYLDASLCKGCINCIKRCPTQAIRVHNGKACITKEYCIDCGECVRTCHHHAKKIRRDSLDILNNYEYTVALPAPSFYVQFNNLNNVNILLTALLYMGFDDVFEVSAGAELVSEAARRYVESNKDKWPIISTACPTVVRLIRVRFPNLIEHLAPINPPVEVAATLARKRAMEKTGLPADKIGIIFISPCPSKVSYVKSPIGKDHSEIDGVIAAKDIYPVILPHMKKAERLPQWLAMSGKSGVSWGCSGGEANGMLTSSYLAADGIENVIRVLEDLEDEKFTSLRFIELNACSGGCVGGVLNVENPYMAQSKMERLNKHLPPSRVDIEEMSPDGEMDWNVPVEYEPVFRLGSNMIEAIAKMKQIDDLYKELPGLDCGSCGAPNCRALAEDIVRGHAEKNDCVYLLREHIHQLCNIYTQHAREKVLQSDDDTASLNMLIDYADKLTQELSLLDSHKLQYRKKEETP